MRAHVSVCVCVVRVHVFDGEPPIEAFLSDAKARVYVDGKMYAALTSRDRERSSGI